jgi:hypothetical protein
MLIALRQEAKEHRIRQVLLTRIKAEGRPLVPHLNAEDVASDPRNWR